MSIGALCGTCPRTCAPVHKWLPPPQQFPDPLVRQYTFRDPSQVFAFKPAALSEVIADCQVVVDTNVLLLPYATGQASLEQIRGVFEKLARSAQLRIPGQVAREFADNRAEKIKTLYSQLSKKRNTDVQRSQYPLLEGVPAYKEVTACEEQITALLAKYRTAIQETLEVIEQWSWDDPISTIYRSLFTEDVVVDLPINREELLRDLKYRQEHRIPPGYKDARNEYSGIGDFLIWKTILKIGADNSKHVVFVSGDEKTDWRYQSENRALYPRFELIQEYREISGGKSFLMITFAELLDHFGAPPNVVEEVRAEEASAARASSRDTALLSTSGNLDTTSLRLYFRRKYPNREHSGPADRRQLISELATRGIQTLSQLTEMLDERADQFQAYEEQRVRTGRGSRFTDVGVVRVSLLKIWSNASQFKA